MGSGEWEEGRGELVRNDEVEMLYSPYELDLEFKLSFRNTYHIYVPYIVLYIYIQ